MVRRKKMAKLIAVMITLGMVLGSMKQNVTKAAVPEVDDLSTVEFATEDDNVYGTKKAEWTSEKDVAKITFTVNAKPSISEEMETNHADIILVIDSSTSMLKDKNGNYNDYGETSETRLARVKAAAKGFVGGILSGNESKVRFGVVSFGNDATDRVKALTTSSSMSNDVTTIINSIDSIASGEGIGTNLQAALHMTEGIVTENKSYLQEQGKEGKQVVVVLSDGEPTYSYMANGYDVVISNIICSNSILLGDGTLYLLTRVNEEGVLVYTKYRIPYIDNNGQNQEIIIDNHGIVTVAQGKELAYHTGASIYAIGYGISGNDNANYVLNGIVSGSGFFINADTWTSNGFPDVSQILASIGTPVEVIIPTATNVKMVDQVPERFDVIETSLPQGMTYDAHTRTLT